MARVTQGAFSAGIVSEGMYARSDTEKFQKGLKDAVNVFVRPQGGISNRAGFEGVTRFDTSGASANQYLVPFAFSTEQTYQLEFTDGKFRVIRDGAYVLDTTVGAKNLSAIASAATAELTLTSSGDAASFPAGCLAYIDDPNGTHKLHEAIVEITGASGADLAFKVFDGMTLDTSTGTWGALGAGATLSKVYEQTHTYDLTKMPDVRFAQDADTMYLAHPDYPPRKIGRTDHDAWTITDVVFEPGIGQVQTASVAITAATQANPVVVTAVAHGLANGDAFSIADVVGMTELNDTLYKASNVTADTIELHDVDDADIDGSAFTAYTSGGTLTSPGVEARYGPDVVTSDLVTYKYAIAAISEDTFEEGLPTDMVTIENDLYYKGSENSIGWRALAGASRYAVYKVFAGALGYIGTTEDTVFVDENITADTAVGVRLDRSPFSAVGDYPSVVSFYEQRLAFGATDNDPQLVEMSRTDNAENFCNSYPSLPDDAFRFRIRDQRVNHIRAFVPSGSFMILTSGGEWEIAPQGDGEYLRPDRRKLAPRTNYGSANVEPLYTGSVVLYVEPSENVIRDYRPNDGSTPPGDLTVIARGLFEDRTIVSWAYAAAPYKLVWCALDNGDLVSMTYMPEHDVWAWTRHEVGGVDAKVKQVSVTREGKRDVLYAVVARTIGGVEVTMTERYAERNDTAVKEGYYVDGGYRATFAAPVAEASGLLHLRGESVVALADGDVVTELIVDATGTVDLGDREVTELSVGISFESFIQTLDVRMEIDGLGSSEGRHKSTSELAIKLQRSRGIEAGTSLERMNELKEWDATLVGGPIPLQTHTPLLGVSGDWERDATTYVRQRNPLPMTVLSISPEWEVGE